MSIYIQSEEYLKGFRRYFKNIDRGRPQKSEQVFMLDNPVKINELPREGQMILLYETVWTEKSHGCVLYDCYETDVLGKPIVYIVKKITPEKLYLERKIENYNRKVCLEKLIPTIWITSGHMGWITYEEYLEREAGEEL